MDEKTEKKLMESISQMEETLKAIKEETELNSFDLHDIKEELEKLNKKSTN